MVGFFLQTLRSTYFESEHNFNAFLEKNFAEKYPECSKKLEDFPNNEARRPDVLCFRIFS
jgi:hypothetical protein